MKKSLFLLLAITVAAGAVQWDVEQIPDESTFYNLNPVITLDEQGEPTVVFLQWDEVNEHGWLKLASKESDMWIEREIAELSPFLFEIYDMLSTHSFVIDNSRNVYVAYIDIDGEGTQNLFFASDTSGEFEVEQLTTDSLDQYSPVVQIDSDNQVHLAYVESDPAFEEAWLAYGLIHNTTRITRTFWWDIDFLIDDNDAVRLFFTGEEGRLMYGMFDGDWGFMPISDGVVVLPSVALDTTGEYDHYHIACRGGTELDSVSYISSKLDWEYEPVLETQELGPCDEAVCSAVDPDGTPYIASVVFRGSFADIYYSVKTETGWESEPITDIPDEDEWSGKGHFFVIDDEGYGHLTYCAYDDVSDASHIYYLKSRHPLGVRENILEIGCSQIEIRESTIYFSMHDLGSVHLDLYDPAGRKVQTLASGTYTAGEHVIKIDRSGLPAGVYFVHGVLSEKTVGTKVTVYR